MSERDLDVVVLGATGVTGRQVAAYLAARASGTDLRWAAAARDQRKTADVLGRLGIKAPETVRADVHEPASLRSLAARARVVLNLVGPYTLHGRPVIEACIEGGTHYADLTGEVPFVRTIIEDLEPAARQAGVKIVQVCGFEALPPDLAVMLAADTARERWQEGLESADIEVRLISPPGLPRPSDTISGGTLQSLVALTAADRAELATDPAALITDSDAAAGVRAVSPIPLTPRRAHDGGVLAPMAPAPFINPAVIHRSAYLADLEAGRPLVPFRYREGMVLGGSRPTLAMRWGAAGAMTATQVGVRSLAHASPSARRALAGALGRVLPGSGFGPAPERMEAWRWELSLYARSSGGHDIEVLVDADGHPGYLATARMLGEFGILLAEDGATPARAGCLTPALALGTDCLERFDLARVRFSLLTPGE